MKEIKQGEKVSTQSMDSFLVEKLANALNRIDEFKQAMLTEEMGEKLLPYINERFHNIFLTIAHKLPKEDIAIQKEFNNKLAKINLWIFGAIDDTNRGMIINKVEAQKYREILEDREIDVYKLLDQLGLGLRLKSTTKVH